MGMTFWLSQAEAALAQVESCSAAPSKAPAGMSPSVRADAS